MSKTEKTVTRSLRINGEAFDALKEDAKRRGITVNTLVNQLFLAYKDFDRYFERMGMIKISSATFKRLLSATSENGIAEVGRQAGTDIPRAIIIAKYGLLSFQTICGFLRMMSDYAKLYEYSEVTSPDGGSKILTLMHDLGQNGSPFLIHYVKAIFLDIDLEPRISSSEHSVIVEVRFPVR